MYLIPKLKKTSIFLSLLFLFPFTSLPAQGLNITVRVFNQKKQPVPFASITIINQTDSTKILQQVADSNGTATFNLVKTQHYFVRISSVDYQLFEKGIFISGNQRV